MATFGELLNRYIERAGITDTELARSTGVQRQTIFRWKEGHTARPRYRDDVIRIAAKLRLTSQERDELLLAAGFAPEQPEALVDRTPAAESEAGAAAPETGDATSDTAAAPPRPRLVDRPQLLLAASVIIMVLVAVSGTLLLSRFRPITPTATPAPVQLTLAVPSAAAIPTPPVATPTKVPVVAQPGEQLLVIAPFVGYTSSELRFNIAGRIREALSEELKQSGLGAARLVIWPEPITESTEADTVLAASRAVLVIWGEYDAGRVRASVTLQGQDGTAWVNPVDDPSRLPLVINQDVPHAARVFALFALGQYYRDNNEPEQALAAFESALALNPTDEATQAALHFYVGVLLPMVRGYAASIIGQSIDHYTTALALRPTWENILYNRGTAHLGRALLSPVEQPDLDAAIADLSQVITAFPRRVDPRINRGIAYYQRNLEGDAAAAVDDFSVAIELEPENHLGHYHRALAAMRVGDPVDWQADLARALELDPSSVQVRNAYCWGFATAGLAARALPYCEEAVAADVTGASLDGRAMVYAQLGRYDEAAADLRAYLDWVRATYPALYDKYRGQQIEQWIAGLEDGKSPFDGALLEALRRG
ncbi:MAG: tetratricopeptide repeat protein [Caldilineaceae bacterium]|nr:tetratricopeptide repeat protein [Caldilineaceae bacterium]